MKKTIMLSCAIAAMLFVVEFAGCKSENIQVIHNDNVVTNNVPVKAFNDEIYIWENWIIGTNRVHSID